MMLLVLLAIILIGVALAAVVPGSSASRPPSMPSKAVDETLPDDESPTELSLRDPVEALLRYGTPGDAARLADQGVDLSALGYRPPDAH